jgi:hydroxyacylglutathione hydrolase
MNRQRPVVPTITAQDVAQRLEQDDEATRPLIIDVREPDEWQGGHIAGATHIPLGQLSAHLSEIPQDRDVVLVCHSGMRSEAATAMLQQAHYTHAMNMIGGMVAWMRSRLPVTRGA